MYAINLSLDDDSETSVGVETPSQDVFRNEDVEKATQSTPPGDQQSKALKRRRPPEPEIGSLRPSVMFLSDQDVANRYAVSRATIWRWTKKLKGFTNSIKIAEGTVRPPELVFGESIIFWS